MTPTTVDADSSLGSASLVDADSSLGSASLVDADSSLGSASLVDRELQRRSDRGRSSARGQAS